MQKEGRGTADNSANPCSAMQSAPGNGLLGGDHAQDVGWGNSGYGSSASVAPAASVLGGRGGTARTPGITSGEGTVGSSDPSPFHDSSGNGGAGIGPPDSLM